MENALPPSSTPSNFVGPPVQASAQSFRGALSIYWPGGNHDADHRRYVINYLSLESMTRSNRFKKTK